MHSVLAKVNTIHTDVELTQGTFSTRFKAPDVYGVFKLRVAHRRLGYTPIEIEQQVRPTTPNLACGGGQINRLGTFWKAGLHMCRGCAGGVSSMPVFSETKSACLPPVLPQPLLGNVQGRFMGVPDGASSVPQQVVISGT